MAEDKTEDQKDKSSSTHNRNEVALEMMKFIAVTTGYGKGVGAAGFSGKSSRTPEEHADLLLQLFERCRTVVAKED